MLRKDHTQKSIAETIGVHPSNLNCELRRAEMNWRSYCYVVAQRNADAREWKGVRITPELWYKVETKLREGQWSPKQISATLAKTGVGKVSPRRFTSTPNGTRGREATFTGTGRLLEALAGHRDKIENMTFDNGKEFAMYGLLTKLLDAKAYFAYSYHSWERGLYENTNGLIRQYFVKGSGFDGLTNEDVKRVERLLKTSPRKRLDYQTTDHIFNPPLPIELAA